MTANSAATRMLCSDVVRLFSILTHLMPDSASLRYLDEPLFGYIRRDLTPLVAEQTVPKQRLLALPVVDAAGHLHGVADVAMLTGDLSDEAARQNADDVFQLIGAHATQPASAWRGFLDRFPWLLCNIGGGLIAALIVGWYESLLDAVIVLALFIPVVLAVSESAAVQSVALTLQSLHGARADLRFLLKALRRELVTASSLVRAAARFSVRSSGYGQEPLELPQSS